MTTCVTHKSTAPTAAKTPPLSQMSFYPGPAYNPDTSRTDQVTQAILDYFISDMRPLSTIQNESFLGLFMAVDPMYGLFSLPSVTQLEKLLQDRYQAQKMMVAQSLESTDFVAVAAEQFRTMDSRRVVLTASFITPEWERFAKTLESFEISNNINDYNSITKIMKEWNLDTKKIAVVNDNNTSQTHHNNTVEGVHTYVCFEKVLNEIVHEALSFPEVSALISKVKQCMTLCRNDLHVKSAMDVLEQTQHADLSNRDKWTSTLKMLQHYSQHRYNTTFSPIVKRATYKEALTKAHSIGRLTQPQVSDVQCPS